MILKLVWKTGLNVFELLSLDWDWGQVADSADVKIKLWVRNMPRISHPERTEISDERFLLFWLYWVSVFHLTVSRSQPREWHCSNITHISSASVATRYGLGGPGIESRWGRDFPHLSSPAPGVHSTSYTMGKGSLPEAKWPRLRKE